MLTGKKGLSEDSGLIKECLRGNGKAQKALYDRFSAKMMGLCYRYVRNKADAEDILQEGFIKVFTSLGQFQHRGSLEGWIRKIMVHTALNFLNKNKRLQYHQEVEDQLPSSEADAADAGVLQQEVLSMLRQLPEGYRTIINLYAIEGYSHKEIAEKLGIAEVTSRSQYSRGKEVLKKIQMKQEEVHIPYPKEEER